jgi:hypothetical protein
MRVTFMDLRSMKVTLMAVDQELVTVERSRSGSK